MERIMDHNILLLLVVWLLLEEEDELLDDATMAGPTLYWNHNATVTIMDNKITLRFRPLLLDDESPLLLLLLLLFPQHA
jgi:hypothetical protein